MRPIIAEILLVEGGRLGVNGRTVNPVQFEAFTTTAKNLGRYWLRLPGAPRLS